MFEVVELYQHHLESFEDEYWNLRDSIKREKIGQSTEDGLIVRAALAAGWFGDGHKSDIVPDERVRNMKPNALLEQAQKVSDAREVARSIDPFLRWQYMNMSLTMQTRQESYQKLGALKHGVTLLVSLGEDGKLEVSEKSTTA